MTRRRHVRYITERTYAEDVLRKSEKRLEERKQAEAELQRLRSHLWHVDRVAQTGAVTASLAHELNQPLTAILSNAQAGLRFLDGGNADLGEIRASLAEIVHDDKRAGA